MPESKSHPFEIPIPRSIVQREGSTPNPSPMPAGDCSSNGQVVERSPGYEAAAHSGNRLITIDELMSLPMPRWLVRGLLEEECLAMFYGKEGTQKTFLMLDLSLHIATGREWHGHPVQKGPVVYVVGEGVLGVRRRVEAWRSYYDIASIPNFFLAPSPTDLADNGQLGGLTAEIVDRVGKPKLIVLDTFARCYSGDENDSTAMKGAVRRLDELRHATEAAIVLVHHSTKNKEAPTFRGSSVLSGAVEIMAEISKEGEGRMKVSNRKMKNFRRHADLHFQLEPVELAIESEDEIDGSAVIVPWSKNATEKPLTATEAAVLEAFYGIGSEAVTTDEWWKDFQGNRRTPIHKRTFERAYKELVRRDLVCRSRTGLYCKPSTRPVTDTTPTLTDITSAPVGPTDTATPPIGVAVTGSASAEAGAGRDNYPETPKPGEIGGGA